MQIENGKAECGRCKVTACLLSSLPNHWQTKVRENVYQFIFPKGMKIVREGAPLIDYHFIGDGVAKICLPGVDSNREQVLKIATKGDFLELYDWESNRYSINVVGLTDVKVCQINKKIIDDMINNLKSFSIALLHSYVKELKKIQQRIKVINQMNIKERVAEALLYLYSAIGSTKLNVSKADVASIVSTSPKVVGICLVKLEKNNIIRREKKSIEILDLEQLKQIIKNFKVEHFKSTSVV